MTSLNLTHPTVLDWGHAPFAAHRMSNDRVVYYADSMRLKIVIPVGKCQVEVIESIRVIDSKPEHQFTVVEGGQTSEWSTDRSAAFRQLSLKSTQRTVILGVSHHVIQEGITERFCDGLVRQGLHQVKPQKKRVTWGDQQKSEPSQVVVDTLYPPSSYGGWGLIKIKIIPNKEEIKRLVAEREMEELELKRKTERAQDERNEHAYPITPFDFSSLLQAYPTEGAEEEVEESIFGDSNVAEIQENADALEPLPVVSEGIDAENQPFLVQEYSSPDAVDTLSQEPSRKRILEDIDELGLKKTKLTDEDLSSIFSSFEDEIKEFDEWLLVPDQLDF